MPGRVGIFSQSGAFGVALLAEADRRGLGLSSFVSAGNRADVSGNDLLQYWQDDPGTDVIMLYLETFGNPRKFARLARRIGRDKPVVALASPARPPGVGDSAGPDEVAVAALFAHSGVIRVDTVAELLDVGVLLAHQPLPAGRRVGVVGNSSALTGLAATACAGQGLTVARGYPRDVGPRAGVAELTAALAEAGADGEVDALVVVFAPPLPGQLTDTESDFTAALPSAFAAGKPAVATFLVGRTPAGVPAYPSVEEAVRALARVTAYADWLRRPAGVPPELPRVDREAAHAALRPEALDPAELLAAYGIEVVESVPARSAAEAVDAATRLGFPVALKAAAPVCGTASTSARSGSTCPTRPRCTARTRRCRRSSARTSWCSRWSRPVWPAWSSWWRTRRSARWSASGWAASPRSCSATGPGGRCR